MRRVRFYIDGFNFYYGIKRSKAVDAKWGNAYWIDVVKLCESFIGPDEVVDKVIYFTASPLSPSKNSRQSAFLNANKFLNGDKFEIVRGKYLQKVIVCPACNYSISKPEEKKTDVNISVKMIEDCIHRNTDKIVLISADTDLIPPLELIKQNFQNVKIKVVFPPSNFNHDFSTMLVGWNQKPTLMLKNYERFKNAIMSDVVGEKYTIPEEWKAKQTID